MSTLENIIQHGNRARFRENRKSNKITCKDGFTVSVIAGDGAYCSPRVSDFGNGDFGSDYPGPYSSVEVGFPSEKPRPWKKAWRAYAESAKNPTETVYGFVPVDLVRALIESHGGES